MMTATIMAIDFQALTFEYRRSSDQDGHQDAPAPLHPVVVIGAGPVGLATAQAPHGGQRAFERMADSFEHLGARSRGDGHAAAASSAASWELSTCSG